MNDDIVFELVCNEKKPNNKPLPTDDIPVQRSCFARHTTPHTEETKQRISSSQKARYASLKELLSMVDTIVDETVEKLIQGKIDRHEYYIEEDEFEDDEFNDDEFADGEEPNDLNCDNNEQG